MASGFDPFTFDLFCHRGHALVGENVKVYDYGYKLVRSCVTCSKLRDKLKGLGKGKISKEIDKIVNSSRK